MGIKIYTYSNPYELTQEMYWDEIKDCPHFCVSQTMVNGFTDLYKHWKNNGCLTTMRILLNSLYADWEDKNTRVRQIMEVDHAIHSLALDEDNIRRSLEYNTKDISIVFNKKLLVFILNIPKQGNISSGYAFSLIGISPPPGSPAGALLSCDGFFSLDLGRDASIIISSACHRSSRMRHNVKD